MEEIEGGYFDKLRAAPISRTALVMGRLIAAFVKAVVIAAVIAVFGIIFGVSIASGPLGFVLLMGLMALWAVAFAGFMQLVALKTRNAAATNSPSMVFFPLLFLTPNFVPRDLLTRPNADYLDAFAAAELELRRCLEPALTADQVRAKRRAFEHVPEAATQAYLGLPGVLVWHVQK